MPPAFPGITPPAFNDLILYQLHVGTYAIAPGNGDGKFLDVIQRVAYLASLGVNAIALLPIQESVNKAPERGTVIATPACNDGGARERVPPASDTL